MTKQERAELRRLCKDWQAQGVGTVTQEQAEYMAQWLPQHILSLLDALDAAEARVPQASTPARRGPPPARAAHPAGYLHGGTMTRIIRVFPRRTSATPRDPLAFVGEPPLTIHDADAVHVSCTFTWDLPQAETIARSWSRFGLPVSLGGPATGLRGEEFTPGMYLRNGYVITSRGCPNTCWFCNVWRREETLRELPIRDGWIVQDDNLLACSEEHIRAVFDMLRRQPEPVQFTGGIEAALLREWHVDLLTTIRVGQLFCAYDGPEDIEPLRHAGALLGQVGYSYANRKARAYVLCGHPRDTLTDAERRMRETVAAGFMPQSMLWRDQQGNVPGKDWQRFHRSWARPAAIASQVGTVRKQCDEDEQRTLPGTDHLADAGHVGGGRAQGGE